MDNEGGHEDRTAFPITKGPSHGNAKKEKNCLQADSARVLDAIEMGELSFKTHKFVPRKQSDSPRPPPSIPSESIVVSNPVPNLVSSCCHSSKHFITECSGIWSVVCFCLSSCHTGIHAASALGAQYYEWFFYYGWAFYPMSIAALGLSFVLKPRRTDAKHISLLCVQYTVFLLAEVSYSVVKAACSWLSHGIISLFESLPIYA